MQHMFLSWKRSYLFTYVSSLIYRCHQISSATVALFLYFWFFCKMFVQSNTSSRDEVSKLRYPGNPKSKPKLFYRLFISWPGATPSPYPSLALHANLRETWEVIVDWVWVETCRGYSSFRGKYDARAAVPV